ncbi:hypothetical protein GMMP15_1310019 [Candidatus Magnetomoraceae bacterium gMMP-15]
MRLFCDSRLSVNISVVFAITPRKVAPPITINKTANIRLA